MKKEENKRPVNPFELIHKVDELPSELKEEVMATIDYTRLITDMAKLFSVDFSKTVFKMIDPGDIAQPPSSSTDDPKDSVV